jgi:hypothetical protein
MNHENSVINKIKKPIRRTGVRRSNRELLATTTFRFRPQQAGDYNSPRRHIRIGPGPNKRDEQNNTNMSLFATGLRVIGVGVWAGDRVGGAEHIRGWRCRRGSSSGWWWERSGCQ